MAQHRQRANLRSARRHVWFRWGYVLLSLLFVASPHVAHGQDAARAGVVIVHGDGRTSTQCVDLAATQVTGLDVLVQAGFDLSVDASNGMGAAICRVDGEGCDFPAQDCFCECQGTPCTYWSYWRRTDDGWTYSNRGASSTTVGDGDVEAWVWNTGIIGREADMEPPAIAFDAICASPTATPTKVPPTTAPTATLQPAATPTPEPTKAIAPPEIYYFSADRTAVTQGEMVLLSWDLGGADAAYLRYDGGEEGIIAPGGKAVQPKWTTEYVLAARNVGGETTRALTVQVASAPPPTAAMSATLPPATAAPTMAPSAMPTAVPTASPTTSPTAIPSPTVTRGWVFFATTPLAGEQTSVAQGERVTPVAVAAIPTGSGAREPIAATAIPVADATAGGVPVNLLLGGLVSLGVPLSILALILWRRR